MNNIIYPAFYILGIIIGLYSLVMGLIGARQIVTYLRGNERDWRVLTVNTLIMVIAFGVFYHFIFPIDQRVTTPIRQFIECLRTSPA